MLLTFAAFHRRRPELFSSHKSQRLALVEPLYELHAAGAEDPAHPRHGEWVRLLVTWDPEPAAAVEGGGATYNLVQEYLRQGVEPLPLPPAEAPALPPALAANPALAASARLPFFAELREVAASAATVAKRDYSARYMQRRRAQDALAKAQAALETLERLCDSGEAIGDGALAAAEAARDRACRRLAEAEEALPTPRRGQRTAEQQAEAEKAKRSRMKARRSAREARDRARRTLDSLENRRASGEHSPFLEKQLAEAQAALNSAQERLDSLYGDGPGEGLPHPLYFFFPSATAMLQPRSSHLHLFDLYLMTFGCRRARGFSAAPAAAPRSISAPFAHGPRPRRTRASLGAFRRELEQLYALAPSPAPQGLPRRLCWPPRGAASPGHWSPLRPGEILVLRREEPLRSSGRIRHQPLEVFRPLPPASPLARL